MNKKPSNESATTPDTDFPKGHNAMNTPTATSPDPFNPDSLRLSGDFAAAAGVKKVLLTIPVRKPDKSWFVRTHPDEGYRLQTGVIELKEERETYLVAKPLWPELAAEPMFSPRALFTAMNRQGVLFLWPCRLPGPDGKLDEWGRTALEAAVLASSSWVRVTANMNLGAYEVAQAMGSLSDPEWPVMPLGELLRVAFKERHIDNINHPVLRRLRGEV